LAQILIRELPDETVRRLKQRAQRNRRSLEAEVRLLLEDIAAREAAATGEDFWTLAARVREMLKDRKHTDSALIIRELRDE
jgi:plasmid stability protein